MYPRSSAFAHVQFRTAALRIFKRSATLRARYVGIVEKCVAITDTVPAESGRLNLAAWAPPLFVLLWSTGFIGAKFGLPYAEPFTLLVMRFGLASLLLVGLALGLRAPWP